jgi:hypothetical protein
MKVLFTVLWNTMNIPHSAMPQSLAKVSKLVSSIVPKSRVPSRRGDLILYGGT